MNWPTASRSARVLLLLTAALSFSLLLLWFRYTADDALIVLRYARNLVNHGELVYNEGEYVSALTSPFHALLLAILYAVAASTPNWSTSLPAPWPSV